MHVDVIILQLSAEAHTTLQIILPFFYKTSKLAICYIKEFVNWPYALHCIVFVVLSSQVLWYEGMRIRLMT